jgi:putative oxidoreductase
MSSPLISLVSYSPILALLLRLFTGVALIIHGYPKFIPEVKQKLVQWMQSMNIPASVVSLVALNEFIGGILLLVGLIVPIVSVLLIIQFLAITIAKKTRMNGAFIPIDPRSQPSYEVDILYLMLAVSILIIGPGPVSVDNLIGLSH